METWTVEHWTGGIGDVTIYGVALTSDQIKAHHEGRAANPPPVLAVLCPECRHLTAPGPRCGICRRYLSALPDPH